MATNQRGTQMKKRGVRKAKPIPAYFTEREKGE